MATAVAAPETMRPRIPMFGQVVAGRSVDLRPLVAGRISAVGPDFREGGYVKQGTLLIVIDPFDFETARTLRTADLAEARAVLSEIEDDLVSARDQLSEDRRQLDLLGREVDRRRQLHGRGAVSQKAVDDAEIALSRQQQAASQRRNAVARFTARVERQQAAIRRAETALARAERDLAETRLTAPFAGWLVDIGAEIGKQVGTAERVARLVDANRLEISLTIPNDLFGELDAGDGMIGRRLEAVWRTGGTVRGFRARIARFHGEIEAASGGIAAFASLESLAEDTRLRPGAFVELFLEGPKLVDAVRLPNAAVFDGNTVYRVGADDRLEAVEVRVRASEGESLLVQGPLKDGQRIVVTRFPEIAPGVRVTVP
ncbi:MAG: efflux RND transporter periplasmic adaptor subunit [Rhodospirillaceae bacterium]|nr:efflux RND transporter periplasmic adaptor subunit [Rhodospirillaceae bacterium]